MNQTILETHPILDEARTRSSETYSLANDYLNPSLVEVLSLLGFDVTYERAEGCCLHGTNGNVYLDMHGGEGFATLGHNHPDIQGALAAALEAQIPGGVQIQFHALSGMLGEELCSLLPKPLNSVYFTSSGAEAVDAAMKFSRIATQRPRFVSCQGGYHGVHWGPLSICGERMFQERFEPLLPGCVQVPHGDLDRLEDELKQGDVAAFIVEPIQGLGVNVPTDDYLLEAERLCRRYGTLFVLDEIQTCLGRTGKWFALDYWGLEPDFVLMSKSLSGGYIPLGAMITRREIYDKVTNTLDRCYVHESTFGRNSMAMIAGLATLRAIKDHGLVENAFERGEQLRAGLRNLVSKHEILKDTRGLGLMTAFEFGEPRSLKQKVHWKAIHLASPGLFPQLVVIPLFRDHHILTMVSSKNDVIKLLPPITISSEQVNQFVSALDEVLDDCSNAGSEQWNTLFQIIKRVVGKTSFQGS
ncbi:MAG: aspartate aminotransferase family protein [Verrucomicrobiota bacterium]